MLTDEQIQQELNARIAVHKLVIVNAHWYNKYMEAEENANIQLPTVIAEKNAKEFSNKLTAQILMSGTLDNQYNEAWFYMAQQLPWTL